MKVLSRLKGLFFAEEDIDQTAAVYAEKLRDYVEESDYAVSFNIKPNEDVTLLCDCGVNLYGFTPSMVIEEFEKHLELKNHAFCDICGKVFTGENAGQKVGGHKRTHWDG